MSVINIEEKEFEQKVLKSNRKVLVDFYADWCGPCKMLSPIIDEISNDVDDIDFFKINVDNAEEISRRYGVMSIPTLIVFENGKEVKKSVGFKSKDELVDFLNK